MKNIINKIFWIIVIVLTASTFALPASASIPVKLKLIAEPTNIMIGEKSTIIIRLLDETDKFVVTEFDIPINISTNLGNFPPSIIIPNGSNSYSKEFTSNVSGIAIISVNSKGLIGDTTSIAVIPASSGGGGGGGVASGEPYENIAKREVREQYLRTGVPAAYTFTTRELPVYEIIITPAKNFGTTSVQVELLKGPSRLKGVTLAPGTIFMHVNVWVGGASFATSENIKEGIIKFKVERKWLADNNFAEGDISMLRWDGSNWIALETQVKRKDDNFTYNEATTNTFSPFAITGLKEIPKAGAPIVVTETPAKPATTPAVSPTEKKEPGFEIVLAAAVLSAVYMFGRKRR
jgi:PGF-pre-PGF domain-containing protein